MKNKKTSTKKKNRKPALALWLVRLFEPVPRCTKCGSKRLEHSRSWTGGWNDYCGQAIGRDGTRCYDCGKIVWDQTDEQYQAGLPKWCRAYKSNAKIAHAGDGQPSK